MKKYLLTLLLAIAGCVTVMAGDDIKRVFHNNC